jgi:hypothetical protein
MPARKKDPSVRARRNKTSSRATLTRRALRSVDEFADLSVAQLRAEIDTVNEGRPADQQLSKGGSKAVMIERLLAATSPIPTMPKHPPVWINDDVGFQDVDWHKQTVAWWADVWTSPMATEWDTSDVHNVMVVALLYDDIWSATSPKARKEALAEYRLQRADLGLSPYSRRRLEWTIEAADAAKDEGDRRRSAARGGSGQPAGPPKKPAVDPRQILSAVK